MSVATEMVNELSLSHEDARAIATAIGDEIKQLTGKRERMQCLAPFVTSLARGLAPSRMLIYSCIAPVSTEGRFSWRSGRVPA